MQYLGFDEAKKMWVYTYREKYKHRGVFGLVSGKEKVVVLPSLHGLNLKKAF
ncbi:hypothetical protein B2K_29650 [Paenibacillus mucilaginosus K02]|nr:hypothetical protein KNP414_06208 [Paenibacillus mucilaginosus KNP414]AFH64818.1 hypothetical protein B2K_29650 [Paenibacillus mucilaginosus K02]